MAEPNPRSLRVLVVDDEPNIRSMLSMSLSADGHNVSSVANPKDALVQIARQPFDLAFVDLRLGTEQGIDLIPKLLAENTWLQVVVITAFATVETAVEAMRRGASDYLPKPFTPAQVRLVVERVSRLRALQQRVAGLEG
ncbi:MAG TPA: response regulator, partial [Tepidisphaeraceae bacterium]|nr:response regulator [Tepidisphaeraceae bacterium]